MKAELALIDGFDEAEVDTKIISGTIVKYNAKSWAVDGLPFPAERELVVFDVLRVVQHWRNQKPIETLPFDGKRPDVKALNAEIPKSEWEIGLDGELREPWQLQHVVYLLDEKTGSKYTALNSTTGMRIAWEALVDRVKTFRKIHKAQVRPIIVLSWAPFKTQYGMRDRPEFEIKGWLGASEPEPKKLAPADIIDDDIPF